MSWEKYPIIKAIIHIWGNTYPSRFKILSEIYLSFFVLLPFTVFYIVLSKMNINTIYDNLRYILLFIFVYIVIYFLGYSSTKKYGITWCATVNFRVYADYIVNNYWKNIQYDIEYGLLKNILVEAKKDKKSNILPEILKKLIQNTPNKYQKKYIIDCIFNICDKENISSYIEQYLLPVAQSDDNVMHFLIEKIHLWSVNNRNPENISLYLHLLKNLKKGSDFEKITICNLVNFIGCDDLYINEYCKLRNKREYNFLDYFQKIRIKNYIDAEKKSAEDIKDYNKKDEMFFDPLNYPVINERGSQND